MALDYKNSFSRYRRYLQVAKAKPLWWTSMWVVLSLGLTILLLMLALRPTLVTIAGLMGQIRQQKEIASQLDQKIVQVRKAAQIYEEAKDRLVLLDEAFPKDPRWKEFADTLGGLASGSGLVLEGVRVEEVPVVGAMDPSDKEPLALPAGVMGMRFEVSASGEYGRLRELVAAVENLRRVMLIQKVDMEKNEKGELIARISGVAGFMPVEETQ